MGNAALLICRHLKRRQFFRMRSQGKRTIEIVLSRHALGDKDALESAGGLFATMR